MNMGPLLRTHCRDRLKRASHAAAPTATETHPVSVPLAERAGAVIIMTSATHCYGAVTSSRHKLDFIHGIPQPHAVALPTTPPLQMGKPRQSKDDQLAQSHWGVYKGWSPDSNPGSLASQPMISGPQSPQFLPSGAQSLCASHQSDFCSLFNLCS